MIRRIGRGRRLAGIVVSDEAKLELQVNRDLLAEQRRLAAARIRSTKTQLSREMRQLGVDLVKLADLVDEEAYPSINPFGPVGDTGRFVDQLATRYDAELSALSSLELLGESDTDLIEPAQMLGKAYAA